MGMSDASGPAFRDAPPPTRWILIADDDDLARGTCAEALRKVGYRVIEAGNGRAALEFMRTLVPHLILLDLELPELSGDDVLQQLRESPVLSHIPVIVVSGCLGGRVPSQAGLNVVGALSKPLRMVDLLRSVRSALAHGGPRRRV